MEDTLLEVYGRSGKSDASKGTASCALLRPLAVDALLIEGVTTFPDGPIG